MKELISRLVDTQECYGISYITHLKLITYKETLIYQNLNKLKQNGDLLRGYFWVPEYQKHELKMNLDELRKTAVNFNGVDIKRVKTDETRPTHFKLNDFTGPF